MRLSIRRKLAAALAVPLAALVGLTVVEVAETARAADRLKAQTELAKAAIGPSGIVTALQNERAWLGVYLAGQEDQIEAPVRGTTETRAQTDTAIAAFRDELTRRNDTVRRAFAPALRNIETIGGAREYFDAQPGPRDTSRLGLVDEAFDRYTSLIDPFFGATTDVALVIDDAELRQGVRLADTAARHFPAGMDERTDRMVSDAITTGKADVATLVEAVSSPREDDWPGYEDALHRSIAAHADRLYAAAEARQVRYGALAVIALLCAIALTVGVSRSITEPLRSLMAQAKDLAEHRLPSAVHDLLRRPLGDDVPVPHVAPVAVRTRDEVGDVAEALNRLQRSALQLAVEQTLLRRNIADSFVNLGRRNQNLLRRQLDHITELESGEADPDALASLFRLDHLATRMRRNAESLLVLASLEPARRWGTPAPVVNVVRAALGEVEDYQRVRVSAVQPATVLGSAAADLAHLLAELLENALTFSPPVAQVEVRGRRQVVQGGYELAVVDHGVGMRPAELQQANRRLAGSEPFTVAPSNYLGHYVAGHLAARHGATVRLDPTHGGGVTATVALPPTMVVPDERDRGALAGPPGPAVAGMQSALPVHQRRP